MLGTLLKETQKSGQLELNQIKQNHEKIPTPHPTFRNPSPRDRY
jgi:hypothetical protein